MTKYLGISLSIVSILLLVSCSEGPENMSDELPDEAGVFLQILLEDQKGQELSYVLFNPNVETVESCEASAETSLDAIVERLPEEYSSSTVTGWACTLTNPEAGKTKIDRVDA